MSDTENKKVTLLLSDLRGFTGIFDRIDSEEVVEMLNRYFAQMNEIIAQYEGSIDKYMGDAILAVFGLADSREDDALRAAACAVEMQLAMEDVNRTNQELGLPQLHMGIGINTGQVTAGVLGSHLHNEFTVIGDEVNMVSRIEAQTLRGQILLSEKAYAEVQDQVEVADPIEIRVKGNEQVMRLYELLAISWPIPMNVPRREVRGGPRVEFDAPFDFQLVIGEQVLPELHRGRIKDMSYQGMFVLIPKMQPQPEEIKLNFSLSLLAQESRPIYARIQTVRELGDQLGCGVEFTSMDADSQEALKTFIDRILQAV
ncbi:MAG: PilZ domain-containing protein [Gammaproteobacteria bacterium]|nr:PilZ domain-containing protein [Gammaproteobacteria bacterium]